LSWGGEENDWSLRREKKGELSEGEKKPKWDRILEKLKKKAELCGEPGRSGRIPQV